jgi:uncharacterized protein YggT (Ycf19 family)
MIVHRDSVVREKAVETPVVDEVLVAAPHTIVSPRSAFVERACAIVYFVAGLAAGIMLVRFALLLLGANANSGFAQFIFQISEPMVAPFMNLFGSAPQYGTGLFEYAALIAIMAYFLAAALVAKLIGLLFAPVERAHVVVRH